MEPPSPLEKPSSASPSAAAALPHILPSNQSAVAAAGSGSSLPSPVATGPPQVVESGPGPLRHPRPMTAAELHAQMEKEQEAVVNRLTRELSILRAANNASAASNASSNASGPDVIPPPPADSHLLSGPMYMTPSRRHNRSSSNASSRSTTAAVAGSTISTPAHPGGRPPHLPVSMSRQSSTTSTRQSSYSHLPSPGPQSYVDPSFAYFQRERLLQATGGPGSSVAATPGGASTTVSTPVGIPSDLSRLEETTFYRSELEAAKRENEALKAKIRQLEKMVHDRRASDASMASAVPSIRSIATSTQPPAPSPGPQTVGLAGGLPLHMRESRDRLVSAPSVAGSVGVGVPEEEVKVGESAASAGLGLQSTESESSLAATS